MAVASADAHLQQLHASGNTNRRDVDKLIQFFTVYHALKHLARGLERHWKTRSEASPPAMEQRGQVRYLAPTDPDSGGTWLLVNECGLTLALLNRYQNQVSTPRGARSWRSRGLLVRDLADCADTTEVAERLDALDCASYNAFTLLAFQPGPGFAAKSWQNRPGHAPATCLSGPEPAPCMPVSSSSFDPETVLARRRAIFAEIHSDAGPEPETLHRFHHFDDGGNPTAQTVLMNRPDAQTWAISHICVEPDRVTMVHEAFPRDLEGASTRSQVSFGRAG
jgi:hypothetical protein